MLRQWYVEKEGEEESRSCRLGVVRERDAELGKAHGGCLGVTSR